jgi:hypothetical protein
VGEHQKGAAHKALDPPLAPLDGLRICPARLDAKPPEERRGRRALDEAVEAKAHQRATACLHAGP